MATVREIAEEINGGPLPEPEPQFMLSFFAYQTIGYYGGDPVPGRIPNSEQQDGPPSDSQAPD
jgi:hypothetical protein